MKMSRHNLAEQVPGDTPNKVFLAVMVATGILLTLFVLWVAYMIWFSG